METESFGAMPDGTPIHLYCLRSEILEARFLPYGATIVSLSVPDRNGDRENVLLGFSTLDGYVRNHRSSSPKFFGSTIGRYANRIADGRFILEGREYNLTRNNGLHSLHGGPGGFYNVVWHAQPIENGIAFQYLSEHGDQGFPGALNTIVHFALSGADLNIAYQATTDLSTVINLTNHAYFNLTGAGCGSILSHQLQLRASRFTPTDADSIPTGELRSVSGTPFDFRKPVAIGERIHTRDQQLDWGKGYDHNFVLDEPSAGLKPAAELFEPSTGRMLEILTTEPAIQLYSGNYLDGSTRGQSGEPYLKHSGLCLETQHFPDSPNHANFPSTVLRPGETFRSETVYRFSTR